MAYGIRGVIVAWKNSSSPGVETCSFSRADGKVSVEKQLDETKTAYYIVLSKLSPIVSPNSIAGFMYEREYLGPPQCEESNRRFYCSWNLKDSHFNAMENENSPETEDTQRLEGEKIVLD